MQPILLSMGIKTSINYRSKHEIKLFDVKPEAIKLRQNLTLSKKQNYLTTSFYKTNCTVNIQL